MTYLSWCYGTDRFFEHIKEMGMNLPLAIKWFWSISWNFSTPLIVFIVLIKAWVDFKPEQYLDYEYEPAVQALGWVLELYPVAIVVVIGIWNVWKKHKEGHSVAFFRVGPMLQPKTTWGPRPDRGSNTSVLSTISTVHETETKNGEEVPKHQKTGEENLGLEE